MAVIPATAAHNGPHPTRWLYTQTDTGAWGWVSDNQVLSETDSVEYC